MAHKRHQPLTVNVTSPVRALRSRMHAAWPHNENRAARNHTIRTITKHIEGAMPDDFSGDINVVVTNQAPATAQDNHGFLYHLTQQQIITRRPANLKANTALLQVHFSVAQAIDELEEAAKTEQTIALSRITQIKAWQQETVKAMFQSMADTALSMEAQTALRSVITGLKKLGALLNTATAKAKQLTRMGTQAVRNTTTKATTSAIAQTLSDLRGNLTLAAGNGLKPPTKAQMAIRQQLKKLDNIAPATQKTPPKLAVKTAPKVAIKTPLKLVVKNEAVKPAKINIRSLPAVVAHKTAAPIVFKQGTTSLPAARRLTTTPTRNIRQLAQRQRVIHATKPQARIAPQSRIIAPTSQKIIQKIKASPRIITSLAPHTLRRFQINRPSITHLRITPATLIAHRTLATPARTDISAKTETPRTTPTSTLTRPEKSPVPQNIAERQIARDTKIETRAASQHIARQPAHYATLTSPASINPVAALRTQHVAQTITQLAPAIHTTNTMHMASPILQAPTASAAVSGVLSTLSSAQITLPSSTPINPTFITATDTSSTPHAIATPAPQQVPTQRNAPSTPPSQQVDRPNTISTKIEAAKPLDKNSIPTPTVQQQSTEKPYTEQTHGKGDVSNVVSKPEKTISAGPQLPPALITPAPVAPVPDINPAPPSNPVSAEPQKTVVLPATPENSILIDTAARNTNQASQETSNVIPIERGKKTEVTIDEDGLKRPAVIDRIKPLRDQKAEHNQNNTPPLPIPSKQYWDKKQDPNPGDKEEKNPAGAYKKAAEGACAPIKPKISAADILASIRKERDHTHSIEAQKTQLKRNSPPPRSIRLSA